MKKHNVSLRLNEVLFKSFILFTLVLTSCVTSPIKYSDKKIGFWSGKVFIKDKIRRKSGYVQVSVNAKWKDKLRLDVTSSVGGHLSSALIKDNSFEILDMKKRKFFSGRLSESSLKRLVSLPINPEILFNVLFDRPITSQGWKCEFGVSGYIKSCEKQSENLKIHWKNRKVKRKLIIISHPKSIVKINFTDFSHQLEERLNLFTLKVPKSFKRLKL